MKADIQMLDMYRCGLVLGKVSVERKYATLYTTVIRNFPSETADQSDPSIGDPATTVVYPMVWGSGSPVL